MTRASFLIAAVLVLATVSGCATVVKCLSTNSHQCGFN